MIVADVSVAPGEFFVCAEFEANSTDCRPILRFRAE